MKCALVLVIVITLILTVFFAGCVAPVGEKPKVEDPYRCLNADQLPQGSDKQIEKIGKVTQALFGNTKAFWRRPDRSIPICWMPSAANPAFAEYRKLVQEKVEAGWGAALALKSLPEEKRLPADKLFHFTGWEPCDESNSDGIRVEVSDEEAHTTQLGQNLSNPDDLHPDGFLFQNFTFKKWGSVCAKGEDWRLNCIAENALHEFGHGLGFPHEQNRPDTDRETCTQPVVGSKGNIMFGDWDINSIMNYCNPALRDPAREATLSASDIVGVQAAYYPELFDFVCLQNMDAKARAAGVQFNTLSAKNVDSESVGKTVEPDSDSEKRGSGEVSIIR